MRKLLPVVLLLSLLFSSIAVSAQSGDMTSDLRVNDNGVYRIEVIAYKFNFSIIDLNNVDYLQNQGMSLQDARNQSTFYNVLHHLDYGRAIIINAKSGDVEHGLLIDELNVNFDLKPPQGNNTYGPELSRQSTLPTTDITVIAYCNIFCGVDHSSMYFEMQVGNGNSFDNSPIQAFGDWRIWTLFLAFAIATAAVIALAMAKPRFLLDEEEE